jgi:hypothetical protein
VPAEFIQRLATTMVAGLADALVFGSDPQQAWLPDADRDYPCVTLAPAAYQPGLASERLNDLPGPYADWPRGTEREAKRELQDGQFAATQQSRYDVQLSAVLRARGNGHYAHALSHHPDNSQRRRVGDLACSW